MVPEHDHIIDTGKSNLTLEELGHVQPGMARIMPEVGVRIWKCYYAGKAKNKPLADFQLKEAVNLMEVGVLLRPKYTDNMYKFIEEQVEAVKKGDQGRGLGRVRGRVPRDDRPRERVPRAVRQAVPALEDPRPAPARPRHDPPGRLTQILFGRSCPLWGHRSPKQSPARPHWKG